MAIVKQVFRPGRNKSWKGRHEHLRSVQLLNVKLNQEAKPQSAFLELNIVNIFVSLRSYGCSYLLNLFEEIQSENTGGQYNVYKSDWFNFLRWDYEIIWQLFKQEQEYCFARAILYECVNKDPIQYASPNDGPDLHTKNINSHFISL